MTPSSVPSEPDQKSVSPPPARHAKSLWEAFGARILLWVAPCPLSLLLSACLPESLRIPGFFLIGLLVTIGFGGWDSTLFLNRKHGKENVTREMVVLKTVQFLVIQVILPFAIVIAILSVLFVGCVVEIGSDELLEDASRFGDGLKHELAR